MNGRRLALLVGLIGLAFAVVPATASALCNGMAATVAGATGGNDVLTGTAGADVIEGLGGNDTINGGAGNDTICGDDGDDTINGEGGDDHLEGGTAGETAGDTVTFLGTTNGISANLSTGVATPFTTLETDSMTGFENLTGSNSFDQLTGDNGDNVIRGLSSADGFEGLGGDDTLIDDVGGASDQDTAKYSTAGPGGITGNLTTGTVTGDGVGTDTLTGFRGIEGSPFDDVLIGDNDNQISNTTDNALTGMGGNDVLEPLRGTDFVDGGSGTDLVTYAHDIAIDLNLSTGTATTTPVDEVDSIPGVENVIGSPEGDTITGDGNNNILDGLDGDDVLTGGGGSDTASFASLAEAVDASLPTGAATGQGSDTLSDIDNLTGSSQDDTLMGDAGPNALSGLDGADTITGGLGADGFFLGAGFDLITANDGIADTIDCEGGGPDSGSVDGPAPAENYLTDCDSDGDAVVDFLDACPIQSAVGADGCPVTTPPMVTPPPAQTQTQVVAAKKKCKKKKKKHRAASVAKKKKCKKKKKR